MSNPTYSNGQWTIPNPECPMCNQVRRNQGMDIEIDQSKPLCVECGEKKAYDTYASSQQYIQWVLSQPQGMNQAELATWMNNNPPPQLSGTIINGKTSTIDNTSMTVEDWEANNTEEAKRLKDNPP